MRYRRLGQAGVKLSEIGLGGWLTFGNAIEAQQARDVMNRAFEVGINFYDTADVYANGKCEQAWGQLLADRRRADYVLASKCFFPMSDRVNDSGLSRKHIMESCHGSLGRLKTDYLDVYQCHRFDPETPLEETIKAMDDLVRQGKILYWGFSEWTAEQIEQCLQICGEQFERPRSSQPRYSAVSRQPEQAIFPLSHKAGIGQVVFSPLAQGVLSGKYKPAQPPPAGSRAVDDRQNHFIKRYLDDEALLKKVQQLQPIPKSNNCTMSQLALAWILRRPEVTSCIIGATKVEQINENAAASGLKINPEDFRRMEEILA